MKVRFLKRGSIIKNHIFFMAISIVYLHVILSLSEGSSALTPEKIWLFIYSHISVILLGIITALLTYKVNKIAKYLFIAYVAYIVLSTTGTFLRDFNKMILTLNFTYILISYYFYLLLNFELQQALYKPGFEQYHYHPKCEYNFPVVIKFDKKQSTGKLSNWSYDSCFVALDDGQELPSGKIKIELKFEGKDFISTGSVDTLVQGGVGIRLKQNDEKEVLGWLQFYDIIRDRGYKLRFT